MMSKKESNIFNHLISSKGFIDWVRNPNETNDFFWKKWMEERPEHVKDLMRAREFVKKLRFNDEKLAEGELNELLGKIIKGEKTESQNNGHGILSLFSITKIHKYAAILILALVTSMSVYFFYSHVFVKDIPVLNAEAWEIVSNPRGNKCKVVLPDGSIVHLNYESTLKYPKQFNAEKRQVELKGEAFFDVTHIDNHPFIVKTGDLETEVFGTSFNINSFSQNDRLNVSLVTGKVQVRNTGVIEPASNGISSVFLEPGEQLSYVKNSHEMIKEEFDVEKAIGWKDGVMIFEDVSFKEFINRLERWYGVNFQIHGSPPKNWKFNGRYENETIDNILIGVKFVYKLDYKIQGSNITIKL